MTKINVGDVSICVEDDCSGINDNDQPSAQAITLTELASAMQVDEDALLQRLAAILTKRESGAEPDTAEG
jgi:hypothetical protein